MRSFPIDTDRLIFHFIKTTPEMEYGEDGKPTDTQKKTPDGMPIWAVHVVASGEEIEPEILKVKVPSRTEIVVESMAPLMFTDMFGMAWAAGNRVGVSVTASGILGA